MKVILSISKMEFIGIQFNLNELNQHKEYLKIRKNQLLHEAKELLGRKINLSSPPEVATALYSDFKLPKPEPRSWQKSKIKSDGEDNSEIQMNETYWEGCTKDSVLRSLSFQHDFPKIILEYRKCNSLLSNWVTSLPSKAILHPITKQHLIYSTWSHTGASTGRISSKNPNLQSLPKNSIEMVC